MFSTAHALHRRCRLYEVISYTCGSGLASRVNAGVHVGLFTLSGETQVTRLGRHAGWKEGMYSLVHTHTQARYANTDAQAHTYMHAYTACACAHGDRHNKPRCLNRRAAFTPCRQNEKTSCYVGSIYSLFQDGC